MTDKILAITNCGSADEAGRIARSLVESGSAACVNILPGVRSVYRWKGTVEEADEWTLLIKTREDRFEQLVSEIQRLHSYELPEVIAVSIAAGLPAYLQWIDENLSES